MNELVTTVLAISDTHGDPIFEERLRERIESPARPDVLLVAGDWSNHGENEERFLSIIGEALDQRLNVGYVLGGHESDEKSVIREVCPTAIDLDEDILVVRGTAFIGAGFAWAKCMMRRKKTTAVLHSPDTGGIVLVSHEPPYGWEYTGIPGGDSKVRWVIDHLKPEFCICGHLHTANQEPMEQKFSETRVINPGPLGHEFTILRRRNA